MNKEINLDISFDHSADDFKNYFLKNDIPTDLI